MSVQQGSQIKKSPPKPAGTKQESEKHFLQAIAKNHPINIISLSCKNVNRFFQKSGVFMRPDGLVNSIDNSDIF